MLGDMAHPERDLPRVITGAMITVMTGFSLMNAAIYICLPFEVIRTSSTVAVVRRTLLPLYQHDPAVIMRSSVAPSASRPTETSREAGCSPDYLG